MEGVIPEKWEFSTFANCYKGKRGVLERKGTDINKSESKKKCYGYQEVDQATGQYKSDTV